MGRVVEGKQFIGFCKRLWFVLVFGLVCWGIQGHRDISQAAPFDSGEDAASLQVSMAGHELVQMARLDEDAAKASASEGKGTIKAEKPQKSLMIRKSGRRMICRRNHSSPIRSNR